MLKTNSSLIVQNKCSCYKLFERCILVNLQLQRWVYFLSYKFEILGMFCHLSQEARTIFFIPTFFLNFHDWGFFFSFFAQLTYPRCCAPVTVFFFSSILKSNGYYGPYFIHKILKKKNQDTVPASSLSWWRMPAIFGLQHM